VIRYVPYASTVEPALRYSTERAVYALAYSPDGERLLAGGGHWYGPAFVACLEPDGRVGWVSEERFSGKVTGVCFDSTARHVATSAVGISHHAARARLYRLSDGLPCEIGAFVHRARGSLGRDEDVGATGVVFLDAAMVLRRTTPFHEDTFAVIGLPAGVGGPDAGDGRRSSRMAVVDGMVATGFWESRVRRGLDWQRVGDGAGLAVLAAGKTLLLPTPHRGDITAITVDSDARTLTTFGSDGSIASWRRGSEAFEAAGVWRTAHPPTGAACLLARGGLVISAQGASVVGEVTTSRIEVWRGAEVVRAWTLNGLARALAAHPSGKRLAVGGKASRGDFHGWVHVFDLDL
jgi:hypothetical protein